MPAAVLPHFHRVIKAIKTISELQLGMEDLNAAGLVFVLGGMILNFVPVCLDRLINGSLKILWGVLSSSFFIHIYLFDYFFLSVLRNSKTADTFHMSRLLVKEGPFHSLCFQNCTWI